MHPAARLNAAAPAPAEGPGPDAPRARRLWLALHLPLLPLEAFGAAPMGPAVAAGGEGRNARVVAANEAAVALGVSAGMPLAGAMALGALEVRTRSPGAERTALERLAAWAGQFSPQVAPVHPATLLVEVGGSLRLFGGLEALHERVTAGARALGYTVASAVAPTPLAAEWLARTADPAPPTAHQSPVTGHRPRSASHQSPVTSHQSRSASHQSPVTSHQSRSLVVDPARLAGALSLLPVTVLGLEASVLPGLGVRTLGECLRLPRDGLARRLSPALVEALDRALGRRPDPRPAWRPPARFAGELPLPAPVHDAGALRFAARRLAGELEGFLRARGLGAARLDWWLVHEGGAAGGGRRREGAQRLTVALAEPTREATRMLALLELKLERLPLAAPVVALGLEVSPDALAPLGQRSAALLPEPAEVQGDDPLGVLVERLQARLGADAVFTPGLVADHRPEAAWRPLPPLAGGRSTGRGGRPAATGVPPRRPLLLCDPPRPWPEGEALARGQAGWTVEAGPERIECGWWQGRDVARDYFVVRRGPAGEGGASGDDAPPGSGGERLWVYRDRRSGRWYLHGLFA